MSDKPPDESARKPEPTQPSDPTLEASPSIPPESIGAYPIVGEVGRGGMGVVYAAEDTRLKRRVAIKVLPEEFAKDPVRIESFRSEAQLLAAMNHPNIATIYSLEESDGDLFITMELIPSETLYERIRNEPLSTAETLSICGQIARALEAAHKKNVVHRDLKPQNVKFTSEGLVKVLDFGLAQAIEVDEEIRKATQKTAGGPLVGTPGYMSPEQLRGEEVDHRTDIWTFGCLLYKCMTGRSPFPGKTALEKAAATMNKEPNWAAVPGEAPIKLRELARRCLEKSLDRRLQDISQALKIIDEEIAARERHGTTPSGLAKTPPNNLPIPLGAFIGRDTEKHMVKRLVSEYRKVTLTGSGGSGKTRLALETAREILTDFRDGVFFMDLAPLTEPDRLPHLMARALGVREESGKAITDSLLDTLRAKHILLILDNCEHLLTASAQWVTAVLHTGPHVRVLSTSRERLRVAGEVVYDIPGLPIPQCTEGTSVKEIAGFESVRLFMDRARAIDMNFELTERNASHVCSICQRLDGIPLALELAAARIRALPVAEIAHRLGDRFRLLTRGQKVALPHHRTLQSLIDWSHDLLSPDEQRLFRTLSVFAGGWTLEAAGKVCATEGVDEWEVVELHSRLVDKSLIARVSEPNTHGDRARFRMLETIRDYARRRLFEAGETEDVHRRHGLYFSGLAEKAQSQLSGPDQSLWIQRLDAEQENLRLALRTLSETDQDEALRTAGALGRYWYIRGHWSEGRDLYATLLSRAPGDASKARAGALNWAGNLAFCQGDFDEAQGRHEESLAARRQLGDRKGVAASLNNLGTLFQWQGQLDEALRYFEDCWGVEEQLGDRSGIAGCLSNIGGVYEMKGKFNEARSHFEKSLEIRRELGDLWGIAVSLNNLGVVADQLGEDEEARSLHEESLEIRREQGNRQGMAESLNNLNIVVLRQGDMEMSRTLEREALNLNLELGDPVGIASTLGLCGARAEAQGDLVRSLRLRGAARALRERAETPLPPVEQEELDRTLSKMRESMGDEAFDRAWEEGRLMSQKDAVRYALSDEDIDSS